MPEPFLKNLRRRTDDSRIVSRILHIVLSPYRFARALCLATGFVVLACLAGLGLYAAHFARSLPDLSQRDFPSMKALATERVASRLEDKRQKLRWTELKDVNRNFLYAVVMSEDSNFFEHGGFELDSILNSMAVNLKNRKYEYGASTISQQVTKNLFLANEKSLVRKAKELLITDRLERRLTKNQILELYLNLAEFGPDLFGVQAAAEHYFGKTPAEVNAAEGAFIALMLPSPRKYHFAVFENRNLSKTHRRKIRRILGDMLANDLISPKQYHAYASYDFMRSLKTRALASER